MVYRKTWFDYILWAVYAGVCVTLLAYVGYHIYTFYVGVPLAKLGAFLPFPILFCLYPGIRLSAMAIRKRYYFSVHAAAMAESVAVSVSFVFGLILRLRDGMLMTSVYEETSVFAPGKYYEMAVVRAGAESSGLAHGMSDLFVRCLRMAFAFLGNSMMAAILFQIVLQMTAMLFAYLAVRKAAGRFAACITLLLFSFSDVFIRKIYVINPECMMLALLLAGLWLVLSFVKASISGAGSRFIFGAAPVLGIVLGIFCYFECGFMILFLFLAGLFTGKMCGDGKRKRLAGSLFLILAGSVAGFFAAVGIDALWSGISLEQTMLLWVTPYLYACREMRLSSLIGTDFLFYTVLLFMASFLAFVFIMEGREQDFSMWLLPCILLSPIFFLDFSVTGFGGVTQFFWCVMAALGLKNALFGGQAETLLEKIEQINAAAAPIPVAEDLGKKPRFLENPLPLPKKHVKREMDYDYEVPEADMHYQIEIADGDDFDR